LDAAAVDARHQLSGDLDRHVRTLDVVGVVQCLMESDGAT
jgi:hypothetical protein